MNNKTILVTGAKGFLGREIAKRLLVSGHQLRLLVRNNGYTANAVEDYVRDVYANEALNETFLNNVEIFEGDITSEFLGLDESVYNRLCFEVDEVFHCAAATCFESQLGNELMTVNVGGTENVLRFVRSGKKKEFHYISTAYVVGKGKDVVYEKEVNKEPQFNNGYEESKYIAEKAVIKYAKENAIPFRIYRPGIIVGDSNTGFTRKFDNLYLFAKVLHNIKNSYLNHRRENLNRYEKDTYFKDKGANITIRVPGDPDALVNLVPIDYVADAIVAISEKNNTIGNIFHITNPNPPKLNELKDSFISVLEIKGVNISIEKEIEREQLDTIEKLFLRQTKTYYSYLFSNLRFDCSNTHDVLEGTGIVCPVIDRDLIKLLLDYAISHSWREREPESLQKVETC